MAAGDFAAAAAEADEREFFATHGNGGAADQRPFTAVRREQLDTIQPLRPIERLSRDETASDAGMSTLSPLSSLLSTLTSPGALFESLGGGSSAGSASPIPFNGAYDSDADEEGGDNSDNRNPNSPSASMARIVATATAAARNAGDAADDGDGDGDGDVGGDAATSSPGRDAATTAGAGAAAATTPTPNGKGKGESFLNRMWQQAATAATDWWLCSPGSARGETRPSATNLPKDFEISFEDIIELEFLGSGALGTVFSGVLEGDKVAIKKFRDAKHVGEEARDLKSLSHPNIVALRGVCSQEPVYCLVMELCLHSVHDVIKGTKIGPELVCNWAKQVACGMEYLHGQ